MRKFLMISFIFGALLATAQEKDKASDSKESAASCVSMHEKMAQYHSKLAECLKAGRTKKECHDENKVLRDELHSMKWDADGHMVCEGMPMHERMHKRMHGGGKK